MMTHSQTRRSQSFSPLRVVSVILILLLLSACTYFPSGVSEYADYLELKPSVGILSRTNGQPPTMVVAQQYGFNLLTDDRIIGTWYLSERGFPSIALSSDGTAQVIIDPSYTKNGNFQWVTGNIIIILYTDETYDVMKFNLIQDDAAFIEITPDYSEETILVIGRKLTANTTFTGVATDNQGFSERPTSDFIGY